MRIAGDEFIARVFSVLSLVSKAQEPVSLNVVTQNADLPKPTVYRILKSLEALGYIEMARDGSGYLTTDKVLELLPSNEEAWTRNNALPLLEEIHGKLNETANLGRMDGLRLRYVHMIESTRPLRWIPDDRLHEELLNTALGRAMVANLPAEKLSLVLPELCKLAGYGSIKKMSQELEDIRKRGWATEKNQSREGVSCYAMPIFKNNEVIAAVSVSIPNVRVEAQGDETIVQILSELNNSLTT